MERIYKVYALCKDEYGISCIEPVSYRRRFLAKMLQVFSKFFWDLNLLYLKNCLLTHLLCIGIGRKTAKV